MTLQSPTRGFSARLLEAKWQAYASRTFYPPTTALLPMGLKNIADILVALLNGKYRFVIVGDNVLLCSRSDLI
uniref:Uncharacterized protein n=1 Tax=mine drainage metagenome TaxID=410659 RepID=E6QNG7_9ZZZZ